tara:strand:- start:1414 stop:1695 length:282 start_codon:yes stop_codon:yes gene_type:complete
MDLRWIIATVVISVTVISWREKENKVEKYYQVIKDLARYEFGCGYYTRPTNPSQEVQVEDLQRRIAEHYPDLKSAKEALKQVQKGTPNAHSIY